MPRWLPLLTCAAAVAAAEPVVRDLGLHAELRPSGFAYTWADASGTRSGDDAYARAWAAGPELRWSLGAPGRPWALLVGVQALYVRDEQPGVRGEQALGRLLLAPAWSPADRWLLSAGPGIGYGPVRWRSEAGLAPAAALTGTGWEAVLGAGLRWQPGERVALTLDGGWLWSRQSLDDGTRSLERSQAGPWLGLSLAWVVDPSTRRLE